jgi:hypothetical protein
MPQTPSPTVWRRWLALELRRLRLDAGHSMQQVAETRGCTSTKVSYMEGGERSTQEGDLHTPARPVRGARRPPGDLPARVQGRPEEGLVGEVRRAHPPQLALPVHRSRTGSGQAAGLRAAVRPRPAPDPGLCRGDAPARAGPSGRRTGRPAGRAPGLTPGGPHPGRRSPQVLGRARRSGPTPQGRRRDDDA